MSKSPYCIYVIFYCIYVFFHTIFVPETPWTLWISNKHLPIFTCTWVVAVITLPTFTHECIFHTIVYRELVLVYELIVRHYTIILLTTAHTVKIKGKISQNFVAFSEYLNFNRTKDGFMSEDTGGFLDY